MTTNRQVAEKVMGWNYDPRGNMGHAPFYLDKDGKIISEIYWNPDTSWNDAGLVIERMRELGYVLDVCGQPSPHGKQRFQARFTATDGEVIYIDQMYVDFADTFPMAVCKAALKTVESE